MKRSGLTDWKNLSSEHVFLLILCVGLTYRVVRWAVGMPLGGDEVMLVLNFLDRSTDNVLDPLENGQVAPPVFIWAIWLIIQYLGTGEWLLRLVPTLASIAALIMMCRFAKKTLTTGQAFIAVSLLAVSYYTVRYGAELKPYSIDLLIAMIILTIANEFRDGSIAEFTHYCSLAYCRWLPFFPFRAYLSLGQCCWHCAWILLRVGIFGS